jgi:uncharacterized protein
MKLDEAIRTDNPELIGKALKRARKLDQDLASGDRPLTVAARGGHLNALRMLIEAGADAKDTGPGGTALSDAADAGQMEAVKFLLEQVKWNAAALAEAAAAAARKRQVPILQILHKAGAKLDEAMQWAVRLGYADVVKYLLKAGANANQKIKVDRQYQYLLHMAAGSAVASPIPPLVAAGADPNARDSRGRTPLMVAAEMEPRMFSEQRRYREQSREAQKTGQTRWVSPASDETEFLVTEALLDGGADATLRDEDGRDALEIFLAENGEELERKAEDEEERLLLDVVRRMEKALRGAGAKGAEARPAKEKDIEALVVAASENDLATIRRLLDAGVDVNGGGKKTTPLIRAAHLGHLEAVKLLVERGADVNLVEPESAGTAYPYNALVYAKINQNRDVVEYLMSVGAKVPKVKPRPFAAGVEFPDTFVEALVKCPVEKAAKALAKIIGGRARMDAWEKTFTAGARSYALVRFKGSEWTNIHGVSGTERNADKQWAKLAKEMSEACACPGALISHEDVSGHSGYELCDRGEQVERFVQGDRELAKEVGRAMKGKKVAKSLADGFFQSKRGREMDEEQMQDGGGSLVELARSEKFRAFIYGPRVRAGERFELESLWLPYAIAEAAYVTT